MNASNQASTSFFGSPDFKRGRFGWAEIVQPGGGTALYRRATTVAGYLDDKSGLIDWTAAMTAFGMAKSPAMLANFSMLDWHDDKSKVKEMLAKAKDLGGGSEAADMGTAFHKLVENAHAGKQIAPRNLPEGFGAALHAYQKAVVELGLEVVGSEVKVVDDEHQIAGTADLIFKATRDLTTPFGQINAGTHFIGDVKTGSVSDYSGLSMGMQLGIYANGRAYDVTSGERLPWPGDPGSWNAETGLILKVDIPNATVTPWWLNVGEAYRLVPMALEVSGIKGRGKKFIAQGSGVFHAGIDTPEREVPQKTATPSVAADELSFDKPTTPAPESTDDPWEPTGNAQVEDQVDKPEPKAETTAETIAREAAACANVGEARELYVKWSREGAKADELKIIATRAAELGATVKGN